MHDTPCKHLKHPVEDPETTRRGVCRKEPKNPFGIQKETDKAPPPVPTGEFSPLAAGILISHNAAVPSIEGHGQMGPNDNDGGQPQKVR